MGFLGGAKAKFSDAKQGISDMNERRKVSELVKTLASFPLCGEVESSIIVGSLITKYLGISHIATIDRAKSRPGVKAKEIPELHFTVEKEREFLNIIFGEKFDADIMQLRGSISVSFLDTILDFLVDTDTPISPDLYQAILEKMVHEASGFDIDLYFQAGSTTNIYGWHREYKEKHFPNVFFPKLEEVAERKFQSYRKRSKPKGGSEGQLVSAALSQDTIGAGRTMNLYDRENNLWVKGSLGMASVTRIVEYYLPHVLMKPLLHSFRNLSSEMQTVGDMHWHLCEDGILELDLIPNALPRWIPKQNIKGLTFGEAYNGRSTDGVTQFEQFYLYMTVETVAGDEFTLFRFLNEDRTIAEKKLTTALNSTLPKLADQYPVYISETVHDISKHYKTTTTYRTTYVWGEF
jgi:hypothetical protein